MGKKTNAAVTAVATAMNACTPLCQKLITLKKAREDIIAKADAQEKIMTAVTNEFMPGGQSRTPEKERQIEEDKRYVAAAAEIDKLNKTLLKAFEASTKTKTEILAAAKTLQANIDALSKILAEKAGKVAKNRAKYQSCFDMVEAGERVQARCLELGR